MENTCQGKAVGVARLGIIAVLLLFAIHGLVSFVNHSYGSSSSSSNINIPDLPLPYGEKDDLLRIGKSCVYAKDKHNSPINNLVHYSFKNPWSCRECFADISDISDKTCKPLKRSRHKCHAFPRMNPDYTPRVRSSYSPYSQTKSATMEYYHDGHTNYAKHNIPMCSLALPCFDLSKCSLGPLKVYSHGGKIDSYLEFAMQQHPDVVTKVSNPSEACLLVIGEQSYNNQQDLLDNINFKNGQNHYIFQSAKLFGSHWDRPFNDKIQFGMASVSPHSMDDSYNREGYDTPLGLYPNWRRPKDFDKLDIHRQRKYLLSFKGNIMAWEQRNWQHRWLASEYWPTDENDIHLDTTCKSSPFFRSPYTHTDPDDYGNLLLNSTFFFCPGGGGVNSFRFPEVLLAGGIPIVTSDFLPPFHPDIDWSTCIIQVSEARVVDIPRMVRDISKEEVKKRQRRCADLVDAVFSNPPDVRQHFAVAMKVWNVRVKSAMKRKRELDALIRRTI